MKNFLLLFFALPLMSISQNIYLSGYVTPADPTAPRDSIPVYIVDSMYLNQPPVVVFTNSNGYYAYNYVSATSPAIGVSFVQVYIDSCPAVFPNAYTQTYHMYPLNPQNTFSFTHDFTTCNTGCDAELNTQQLLSAGYFTFEPYDYNTSRTYTTSNGVSLTATSQNQRDSLNLSISPDSNGFSWICVEYGTAICQLCDTLSTTPPVTCTASFIVDTVNSLNGNAVLWNTSSSSPTTGYLWDFGDGNTSTNPFPTHTYAAAGTYTVCLTITDGACTSVFCDTLGMDANGNLIYRGQQTSWTLVVLDPNTFTAEEVDVPQPKIFPNPVATHFFVSYEKQWSPKVVAHLIDFTGRSVATYRADDLQAGKISVAHLPKGVYFLQIENQGHAAHHKIVIQ